MSTSVNKRRGSAARFKSLRRCAEAVVFTVATTMLFAGCSVGPKYNRPSVSVPPAFAETATTFPGSPVWAQASPSDDKLRGKWWEVFGEPELNELQERAATSNQNIVAAAAHFLVARALVREARSQYFPNVITAPSIVNARPSPVQFSGIQTGGSSGTLAVHSYTEYSLPFDASWEPDLWGRIRNNVRANTFAAQVSAADLENVRLSEQAELAVDYYQLRAQDSLTELFDSTVAAYRDALQLNQSLQRAGLVSDEAVAQAETQLKAAEAQDTNVGILRAQYEHAIAVLIGEPSSTFRFPAAALGDSPPPVVPVGIPSQLLERRPDIASAERSVAQANAQIGVAKAAYFPNLLLTATGGLANSSLGDWLAWPSRFWSIGPTLTQTLFDAGLRRATMAQYRATYDENVASYRETVLVAFAQVEDNLAALRILSQTIEQQDAAVTSAKRSLDEATIRYKAGLDPYLNVINAQTVLLNNRQSAVMYRIQRMVSSIQLIKALGGGWDGQLPSTVAVNRASW